MTVPAGSGPNALHLESSLRNSEPTCGFIDSIPVTIGEFYGANAQLGVAGAGVVGFGALEHGTVDMLGLIFDPAVDTADVVRIGFVVPTCYAKDEDKLELVVYVRKIEGGTANPDLAMTCTALYMNPDSTVGQAQAAESLVFATASGNTYNYERFVFDVSGLGLKPGSVVTFSLALNEAPGASNFVHMLPGAEIRYLRHASYAKGYSRVFGSTRKETVAE